MKPQRWYRKKIMGLFEQGNPPFHPLPMYSTRNFRHFPHAHGLFYLGGTLCTISGKIHMRKGYNNHKSWWMANDLNICWEYFTQDSLTKVIYDPRKRGGYLFHKKQWLGSMGTSWITTDPDTHNGERRGLAPSNVTIRKILIHGVPYI